jgi:protein gp37
MVFVCDTGDLFHPTVSQQFQWEALDMMCVRDDIDWQILTKRAHIMRRSVEGWLDWRRYDVVPVNIWLGITTETQARFDFSLHFLRDTRATVRWISYEPALGPLRLYRQNYGTIDWVIAGGESGGDARPDQLNWYMDLLQNCREMGIAFFMKQRSQTTWGSDFRDFDTFPIPIQIREFPDVQKICGYIRCARERSRD